MTKLFEYRAVKVQQTPSSRPFYLLSCKAEELLYWCDVPRKKEEFMAGYQRDLSERHVKIKEFFETDEARNIIPNAIIVAGQPESYTVEDCGDGTCKVRVSVDEIDIASGIKKVLNSLKARLGEGEIAPARLINEEDPEPVIDQEEDEATTPQSYLATLTQQLSEAGEQLNGLQESTREAVIDYVKGMLKPGLIIDGQHRVFGAKNVSQFDVYLPVVLIPGMSHEEQVFHFYVLNNKARPLSKTELRTIVSTSLSNKEIDDLYTRFKQVGVTAEQTEWTFRMNTDPHSPFRTLINFGFQGSNGPIPENVAYQLVSRFMQPNRKYRMLVENVAEWDGPGAEKWHFRLKLFFGLWRAIKELYPSAWQAAEQGTNKQLLQKVCLINLQEYLFDTLNQEMPRRRQRKEGSPFGSDHTLNEEVKFSLNFLKEEFFVKEWKVKGLDTSVGHKVFREALNNAITNQSSNLGNLRLFRASS
jgi:DGQHR domain-containing protein